MGNEECQKIADFAALRMERGMAEWRGIFIEFNLQ
jgi:hypothetical protein